MKAVPGILPTLLEMICFFSTPTIDVEPNFLIGGGFGEKLQNRELEELIPIRVVAEKLAHPPKKQEHHTVLCGVLRWWRQQNSNL